MTAPPSQDTQSQESFADHLQTESPAATRDSASDTTQTADVQEVPANELAFPEDQEPAAMDETGGDDDAVAAAAQPAMSAYVQPNIATNTQAAPIAPSQLGLATGTQPTPDTKLQPVITTGTRPAPATQSQPDNAEPPQPMAAVGKQPAPGVQSQPASPEQPAGPAEQPPTTTELPQPALAVDLQAPHSTEPSTTASVEILPVASSGEETLQPEKSPVAAAAAAAAATPGVTQPRTGRPAAAVTAASASVAGARQTATAVIPQVASAPGAVPGTGGLSVANDQAASDPVAGSAEKPAGKTSAEKTGSKSRTTGASGQNGESPTLSIAKPDSGVRTFEDSSSERRAIEALVEQPTPGAERAEATSATAAQDVEVRADANGRVHSLAERLPDQLFARSSSGVQASQEITQPDQMRLVQRVARAIEAAPQRGGLLRLRLRPPELGAVRLEVFLARGNLTARIETETQQARNVLLEHLPQLRERLTAQGIHVEQFDVNVSSRNSSETPFQSHDPLDSRPPSLARRRAAATSGSATESLRSPDLSVNSSPGKLNVVI
ncbi:MAG: flagellar hook-length control protein FliK [Pirellulaceae bacterium]